MSTELTVWGNLELSPLTRKIFRHLKVFCWQNISEISNWRCEWSKCCHSRVQRRHGDFLSFKRHSLNKRFREYQQIDSIEDRQVVRRNYVCEDWNINCSLYLLSCDERLAMDCIVVLVHISWEKNFPDWLQSATSLKSIAIDFSFLSSILVWN